MTRRHLPTALLILAALGASAARADDALEAQLAVNRARAAVYGFESGDVTRDVDAHARRGSFYECADDARTRVRALSGRGRAEAGHALNLVLLEATFATCWSTEGLGGRGYLHRLITPEQACDRLDREALGATAPLVECALLAVHEVATKSYPARGWTRGDVESAKELFRAIVDDFDEATAALRALLPGDRRYVSSLARHLDDAVNRVRRLEVRGGGFAGVGGEARKLRDVGTLFDDAYVAARTPPFATGYSGLIQAAGLASKARPGDTLTATIGTGWTTAVRVDAELVDSTGALRGLQVHRPGRAGSGAITFRLSLPVPADTTPGPHRLLVSVLCHDGSVMLRAFLLDVAAPRPVPSAPAAGLLGAVDRVRSRPTVEVLDVAHSGEGRRELAATVRLVSSERIVGWEARFISDEGRTHAIDAGECDGQEVEVTALLRTPTPHGSYRVVMTLRLADGTTTSPLLVTRYIISPAGTP